MINMIKNLTIALLGLALPVLGQSVPKTSAPAPAPAPVKAEPAPPAKITLPLSQEEQLQVRLQVLKTQEKNFASQLKNLKKQGKQNKPLNDTIAKIKKAHGWGDEVSIQDQNGQISGVK